MKGKQLTLEQVMDLKDGTKVYIEDIKGVWNNELCIKKGIYFEPTLDKNNPWTINDDENDKGDWLRIRVYKWINDKENVNQNDIYSNTYNGWEILKLYKESKIDDNTIIKYFHRHQLQAKRKLGDLLKTEDSIYIMTDSFGLFKIAKPKLDPKPVTFDEVLNSDKRCRVEHESISELCKDTWSNSQGQILLNKIKNKEFMSLPKILFALGRETRLKPTLLKDIIKEGKWYLEP